MARVKVELPASFSFSTQIPVRITDINYGNHVGNDSLLSIIHESRMQLLSKYGFTELNCGGTALIMSDVAIEFRKELFYGDVVEASLAVTAFSKTGFEIYYQLSKTTDEQQVVVAKAKTGMLCFNYSSRQLEPVPALVRELLETVL